MRLTKSLLERLLLATASLMLCLLLVACATPNTKPGPAASDAVANQLEGLRKELHELKAEVVITRSEVAKLRQEVGGGAPNIAITPSPMKRHTVPRLFSTAHTFVVSDRRGDRVPLQNRASR